ncbi:MAG: hypothetical protein ACYSUB_04680 [Planctomycetota bacterium]|jgi:hypothetical protein
MKKSEPTIPFVIVCIGALIAAYAIGLEIRKIRFKGAQIPAKVVTKSKKPAEGPAKDKVAAKPSTTLETPDQSQDTASAEEESTLSEKDRTLCEKVGLSSLNEKVDLSSLNEKV